MVNQVLYSTNPRFTRDVCERYRSNLYSVWCSEFFDTAGQGQPYRAPSSNPKRLYHRLLEAARTSDRGDEKIAGYRRKFKQLARDWRSRNEINANDLDDIYWSVSERGPWHIWRPMLYVIPRANVEKARRLHLVPIQKRAGMGEEFQIVDLHRSEFDMIELEP